MGVTELVFELLALEANIKGVFDRLYYWYGNLLCHEDYHNLFTFESVDVTLVCDYSNESY